MSFLVMSGVQKYSEGGTTAQYTGTHEEVPTSTSDSVKQTQLTEAQKAQRLKMVDRFVITGGSKSQQAQLRDALSAYVLTDDGYRSVLMSKFKKISINVVYDRDTSAVPSRISFNFKSVGARGQISIGFGENNVIKNTVLRVLSHEVHHAAGGYGWGDEVKAMIHENRVMKQHHILRGTPDLAGERRYYGSPYNGFDLPPGSPNYLE